MLKDRPQPQAFGGSCVPSPGACMSQRSGHSGGEPCGRWEGAEVLSSLPHQAQGVSDWWWPCRGAPALLSLSFQLQNSPVCLEKASDQSDNTSQAAR